MFASCNGSFSEPGNIPVTVYSGDFSASFEIFVYEIDLSSVYETGLPVVCINTVGNEDPSAEGISAPEGCWGYGIQNAPKIKGQVQIINKNEIEYDSGFYKKNQSGMTIKIRGNTSAFGNKKPYKIKLQTAANLLGDETPENIHTDWVLLCGATSLNSSVGFSVSEYFGFNWVPEYRYVNLIINNDYKGIYLLTESVDRGPGRIAISDSGYIIERDAYWWNENIYFRGDNDTCVPMGYTFKYPDSEKITDTQIEYIQKFITQAETSLLNDDYQKYFDIDSFSRWVLVHDILGSWDAGGSNIYITKYDDSDNSKLIMTSPWDFDSNYMQKDTWSNIHTAGFFYFDLLFQKNGFVEKYSNVWNDLCGSLYSNIESLLMNRIGNIQGAIDKSRKLDSERWGVNSHSVSHDLLVFSEWINSRIEFLNKEINNLL